MLKKIIVVSIVLFLSPVLSKTSFSQVYHPEIAILDKLLINGLYKGYVVGEMYVIPPNKAHYRLGCRYDIYVNTSTEKDRYEVVDHFKLVGGCLKPTKTPKRLKFNSIDEALENIQEVDQEWLNSSCVSNHVTIFPSFMWGNILQDCLIKEDIIIIYFQTIMLVGAYYKEGGFWAYQLAHRYKNDHSGVYYDIQEAIDDIPPIGF